MEASKNLLDHNNLAINTTRTVQSNFIVRMANFYNEKIIEFKKSGILDDLNLGHYKDDQLLKYDKNELENRKEQLSIFFGRNSILYIDDNKVKNSISPYDYCFNIIMDYLKKEIGDTSNQDYIEHFLNDILN